MKDALALLKEKGIRPTTQRVAVGQYVFNTSDHPSAEIVLKNVQRRYPTISRATIYNVLDLFVREGLLRRRALREGVVVYDPLIEPHHHFIDEKTGAIQDVPLEACDIRPGAWLRDYDISEYHIVLRGRRRTSASP